jgi:hypothetical protein
MISFCRTQDIRQQALFHGFTERRATSLPIELAKVFKFDDNVVVAQVSLTALRVERNSRRFFERPHPSQPDLFLVRCFRGLLLQLPVCWAYLLCCSHLTSAPKVTGPRHIFFAASRTTHASDTFFSLAMTSRVS